MVAHTPAADHPQLSAEAWHYQIEAMKLAFADSDATTADQHHAEVPVAGLLDPAYLAERATLIGPTAAEAKPGEPVRGGTVYLCAADAEGMMVSFIPVELHGLRQWGGRPVTRDLAPEPGGGVRARRRPSERRRTRQAAPTHDHPRLSHQRRRSRSARSASWAARCSPRVTSRWSPAWSITASIPRPPSTPPGGGWSGDGTVAVEPQVADEVVAGLEARGHRVVRERSRMGFGRGQIIRRSDDGVYAAGSEPRADGAAVGI